jgi:hypothetical protein
VGLRERPHQELRRPLVRRLVRPSAISRRPLRKPGDCSLVGPVPAAHLCVELFAVSAPDEDFDVAAVRLPSGTWTSPPAKAQKRFVNGKEDDLVFYYGALKTQA